MVDPAHSLSLSFPFPPVMQLAPNKKREAVVTGAVLMLSLSS